MMKAPWVCLAALLLAACAAPAAYPTPVVILPQEAGRIVDAATATAAAQATGIAAVELEARTTSTAVANAATAAALTPTARAILLAMQIEGDRATATAQAGRDQGTQTPAAATAQAGQTRKAEAIRMTQTQVAGDRQAVETQSRATEQAERRAEQQRNDAHNAERWGSIVDAVTAIAFGVLICGSIILVTWLYLLSREHVAREAEKTNQERAKALAAMIARTGNSILRYNEEIGQWEVLPALPAPRPENARPVTIEAARAVPDVPHINVVNNDERSQMEMSGKPAHRDEVAEFLQRVVDYQEAHNYPRNKIPRWDKLGAGGAQRWSRIVGYLEGQVTQNPPGQARGTYVVGRFSDVADLLQRILQGSVVPG